MYASPPFSFPQRVLKHLSFDAPAAIFDGAASAAGAIFWGEIIMPITHNHDVPIKYEVEGRGPTL